MSRRELKRREGFSLMELTVVICIIGLLASIAIPAFALVKMKAKKAERLGMIRAIEKSVFQYMQQKDSLVTACGVGCTCLNANPNPAGVIDGSKHPFDPTLGDWLQLGFAPDGWLYYQYTVTGSWCPTTGVGSLVFQAGGDLDSDGAINWFQRVYTLSSNTWQLTSDGELPGDLW